MKKIVIFFILSFLLIGCANSYYGYVYDYDKKKPLKGVLVNDFLNNTKTFTDSNGYFSMKYDGNVSSILIFSIKEYKTDTIKSIQIHNGESIEEKFKGETIY